MRFLYKRRNYPRIACCYWAAAILRRSGGRLSPENPLLRTGGVQKLKRAPVSPNCAAIANRPEADRVVSPYPMDPAPFSAVLLAVLDARTPAWRVVAVLFVLAGALFLRFKS